MTLVLLTWLVWAGVFIGIGLGVLRLAGEVSLSADRCIAAYWTGLAGVVAILQIWSLVGPIRIGAAAAVLLLGMAGVLGSRRQLAAWQKNAMKDPANLIPVLLMFGVALWMADWALALPGGIDASGYHLQAVRWAHTFAATPGLANLHHRLGFNNAIHLVVAMMGSGPWESQGSHFAPGLFVLGLWAPGILALTRVWGRSPARAKDYFNLFLLPVAFLLVVGGDMSSPSSDLPAAAVTLAGAAALFAFLIAPPPADSPTQLAVRSHRAQLVVITLLLGCAVCMKLSAAVFAGVAWVVMAGAWLAWGRRARVRPWAPLAVSLAWGAMLVVPWCARGVVLSGYPFFPSSILPMPVPWKAPVALVDNARLSIQSSAHRPGSPVAPSQDYGWMADRWREFSFANPMAVLYPLEFAAIGFALVAILAWWRKSHTAPLTSGDARARGMWLLLPCLAAIIVWFLGAPALRFAWHLFFIPPVIAAATLIPALATRGWLRTARAVLAMTCLALVIRIYDPLFFRPLLAPPGLDHGFQPTSVPALKVYTTQSGLRIFVATDGNCWDSPLPCTIEIRPNLRLLRPNDLASGFTLNPQR